MRGDAKKLVKMLQGAETRFVIPVYQRNYDWKREQCKRLFDDLEDIVRKGRTSHFFGSIVSKSDAERRVLIDGQQRVTTSYLLLAALLHQAEAGKISYQKETLPDFIRYEYLLDRYDEGDSKLKLKLVKDDQGALAKVMHGSDELVKGSNVTENYRYFLDRIAQTDLTADELKDAMERLVVIDIKLEEGDDAQLIFESLNSTGLDLTEGDKIRNYVLMNQPEAQQQSWYEKYWNKIEVNTGYDVSSFVRDYLTAKTRRTPVTSRVYPAFREYADGRETEPLLAELLRFSGYYACVTSEGPSSGHPDKKVAAALRRLGLLEVRTANPYLLSVLECEDRGEITALELAEALGVVENYLFRRWVCGVPANALNKVFESLHHEAMRGVADGATYCEALRYALLRRDASGRFPLDAEFRRSYDERNFYAIGGKRLYLYDCLENGDNVERVNVVKMLEEDELSVEHIMPQTLSRAWRDALGPDSDAVHDAWLNRMGNLTLTGYNSQYSNSEFAEKRDREHGFSDSGLKLNRFVAGCEAWGEEEIRERHELLWRRFLRLWPEIASSYVPQVKERETHALDEGFEFTNRKIAAYTFQGTRHPVASWVDMMQGVLRALYEMDPAALRAVAFGDRFPARFFSASKLDHGFEVGGGVWFYPKSSTGTKVYILQKVIDRMDGVEAGDLSFELYDPRGVAEGA